MGPKASAGGKRATAGSNSKGPAGPAKAHVLIAALSLPPGVPGEVKGEVVVCVDALHWKYRQPPAQVQLRICWWGAPEGTDAVVPFHASRGAGAAFPITSGPRFLIRYLRDMGNLLVSIEECPSARVIGTVSLDTSQVDVSRPLELSVPCLGANKQVLAIADVSLCIRYSQLLSSFEMAEHLASADKALPLYPLASVPNSRHQPAAGGAAAVGAAAAAATTTVITGAIPSAARLADTAPAAATGRHRPATKSEQQQQQLQQWAASPAETQQASLDPPKDATSGHHSAALCDTGTAATVSAVGLSAAGAAGTAGGQQQQQQLHSDPLLEVIRKAEQLKQSLDQAAKAGVMLGLLPSIQQPHHGVQQQYPAVPSLQAQPHQQQQQQMRSPLQAAGSPSLLTRARIQSPGAPRALLLGPAAPTPAAAPAGHSGSGGYSRSLLTAGELLAALAPAMPAGHAAAAPGNQLHDQHEGSHGRHAARGRRHHQHALLRAAAAGSSSDDERSSSSSTHTASSRGSSGSSSSGRSHHSSLLAELDGLEELEDLLLQELLNIRAPTAPARHKAARQKASPHRGKAAGQQHQQQDQQQHGDQQPVKQQPAAAGEGVNLGATAAAAAGQGQVARKEGTQQQATAAGASLHVNLVSVHGLPAVPSTLTAVIKCAGQQQTLDITSLMQQPSTPQRQHQHEHTQQAGMGAAGGVVSSCSQDSCSTTLAVPAGLLQPLAGQHPFLVVEVWAGEPVVSQAKGAAAVLASSHLLGIVRVPLQLPSQQQQQQQQALAAHMQYLTGGAYPVYDILQGQAVGTLELSMHLLGPAEPAASAAAAAAAVAIATEGATAVAGATTGTAAAATADASDAVAAEGQAVSAGVLGVRHVIDVTLVRASGLPVATDLAAMQQPIPDKRFVKYSFPGDEPLYTQEVECVSEPVFAAHARHTVLLQPGESVTECFAGEPGTPEDLLFEVYDKWPDDSDSLAVVGSLPLEQVLSLCQAHASSSAAAGDISSTATVLVPLYPERAAAQPAARPVNLQVSVSYSCSPCWALEGPEDELQVAGPEGCREATPGGQQQQLLKAAQPQQQDQDQGQLDVQRQMQQGGCCPNPMPAEPPQAPLPPSGLGFGRGSEDSLSSQKYPPVTHDSAAAGQQQDSRAGPVGKNAVGPGYEAGVSAAAAARPDSMKPAAAAADPVPPMLAELCVKVVRACGLQAAVKEAEGWLGNASGLLGRARQLGPHPYVTVALMPGSSTVPAVRTPFQAQTFCPQFHYQHVLPIRLDPSTLTALASSDACVELWHHCPRSQAVAAALSRGLSSSYAMAGQQQVFLGSATLPLQGLLIYPQGICRWVVLRSQLGAPVAAVQLEVSFTHIGGTPVGNSPAAMPPLLRHPEWLELLPAAAASRLSGYAALPPSGFSGQWVQLSVHVEELLLPGGDDAALERPKIASYIATFRLPGSSCEHSTQSKACSSHAATSNLLARSWHVDWKFCSHTWAVADARLAAALLGYPLVLAVYKQEPSRGPVGAGAQGQQGLMVKGRGTVGTGRGQAAEGPALVPCGSVEVDLSPLLAKRPGSSAPGCRWLSGTYPVIHPLSKALGNTRLRLKVLLELEPQDTPSEAWLEAHP